MKYTVKKTHRLLAIFLIVTVLLPSVTPYGTIWANNNGPNAPEAASFEPVDATDMVNLLTGDFSYVLPLMNVPSPEGGYPIALAYHGGIAMDLQSSWVGLGWNLNPGAINRSVNGYPDDYSSTQLTDYFYDSGGTEVSYGVSLGYIAPNGFSVGVGYNWGSNQSSSGFVSVGVGPVQQTIGFNQPSSVGISVPLGDVLSLGVSVSSNGKTSASIGARFDSNGTGFNIGASTDGTYSAGISKHNDKTGRGYSLGTTFSSEGVGLTVGLSRDYAGNNNPISDRVGIGSHTAFNTTAKQGDYTIKQSGFTIPIIIPTPIGIFSFSFGKKKVVYFSAKKTSTLITGPLNFGSAFNSKWYYKVKCHKRTVRFSRKFSKNFSDLTEAENYKQFQESLSCSTNAQVTNLCTSCTLETIITDESFMDIYEVPLSQETSKYARGYNITYNNPVFPAYDKYEVQGQGLSGSIHATLVDNGRLYGLSKETEDKEEVTYEFDGLYDEQGELPQDMDFRPRPEFYFDNEITSYLAAPKANFDPINTALTKGAIADIFKNLNGNELETNRFKKSNYIEYATNEELIDNDPKDLGFLTPETPLDRSQLPKDGIGAYKVIAADGKTYHYALPVYNHETITRTYGIVNERPQESRAYLEKRQLEPYATHWLLTAVTGPDYIDNGNGIADEGDLGYWVNFDYGLWSDAYVWSPHPDKDYIEDKGDNNIKTWVKGRKQVYYLDKINTRTHTAVFIKSLNQKDRSLPWTYNSVAHDGSKNFNYLFRFNIPEHYGLKLDRILLMKNADMILEKNQGVDVSRSKLISFNNSNKPGQRAAYNRSQHLFNADLLMPTKEWVPAGPSGYYRNVIVNRRGDNWQSLRPKALKEIILEQDHSLSDQQLSLKSVAFNGKQSTSVLPPYRFSYIEDANYEFNKEDANDWGYYANNPALWSLNEITTPQGGKIQINYEPHQFKTVKLQEYLIDNKDFEVKNQYVYEVDNKFHFKIGMVLNLDINYNINFALRGTVDGPQQNLIGANFDEVRYSGGAVLKSITTVGNKKRLTLELQDELTIIPYRSVSIPAGNVPNFDINSNSFNRLIIDTAHEDFYASNAGIRVASISTTNGVQKYSSNYIYGENEDGVGWITYSPYAPKAQRDVPYSTELPPSRPMYEYVTHNSTDANGESTGKVVYQFNVLTQGDQDRIKYGDFYELQTKREESKVSGNKEVSINAYEIRDNLNCIGQLLSVATYNRKDQLLTKLSNTYYAPHELPYNMGVVQESYQSYKKITKNKGSSNERYQWMVNSSTRVKYPSLLKSSTELKNGVRYTTSFSDFDMISGQAKRTYSTSSLGLEMKTESEPAFYHYPEMGSKADNVSNKNMLSQKAQSRSYFKKKTSDPWKLYDVEVDTWKGFVHKASTVSSPFQSNEGTVWRKFQRYTWNGAINSDGSYKNFTPFKWDDPSLNSKDWRKTSEILRYSNYSNILETQDINGNKTSKKLGDKESKVMAVCNAPYDAMLYANFEYEEDFAEISKTGGIMLIPGSTIVSTKAHTGTYSLKTPSNNSIAFSGKVKGSGKYKASIWVDKDNYEGTKLFITEGSGHISYNPQEIVEAGDWVQLNFNFEIAEESWVSVQFPSGQTYFDDFRIHPVSSTMATYVYNQWDELTYILGANNMATKYEYDAAGKLHKTYTEVVKNKSTNGGFKLINKTNYNYKNQ